MYSLVRAGGGAGVLISRILDLKTVPNLEQVLDNKNALTILNFIFKQFPFRSFTNRSNIFKNVF